MVDRNIIDILLETIAADLDAVNKIYSFSKHGSYAQEIMNALLDEHPDWKNILQMLAVYPVQLWASSARSDVGIDVHSIKLMIESESDYFGIQNQSSAIHQQRALEVTDKAISLLGRAIDEDSCGIGKNIEIIQAVHGVNYPDVSLYIMKQYYKDTLIKLCEVLAGRVNRLLKSIERDLAEIDKDIKLLYHDADLLVRVCGDMHGKTRRGRRYSQVDYDEVYRQMKSCIDYLKYYPFAGHDLQVVIDGSFRGQSEALIAEKLNRSRTYVRKKYDEGVVALGCLIWGYTTPQILGTAI